GLVQGVAGGEEEESEKANRPDHHRGGAEVAGEEGGDGIELRQEERVVGGRELVPGRLEIGVVDAAREKEARALDAPMEVEVGGGGGERDRDDGEGEEGEPGGARAPGEAPTGAEREGAGAETTIGREAGNAEAPEDRHGRPGDAAGGEKEQEDVQQE